MVCQHVSQRQSVGTQINMGQTELSTLTTFLSSAQVSSSLQLPATTPKFPPSELTQETSQASYQHRSGALHHVRQRGVPVGFLTWSSMAPLCCCEARPGSAVLQGLGIYRLPSQTPLSVNANAIASPNLLIPSSGGTSSCLARSHRCSRRKHTPNIIIRK